MDGGWFEPRCTPMPNCSYLLMCLRNNILHLALSRCQAVWPGGDVLNGILIIEIFAALAMPFCWLWSFRQMVSITHVQLENRKEGGGGVRYGLCENLTLLNANVWRFYKTYRIHQHLIVKIVPANFTAHYLYEYNMFYPCISYSPFGKTLNIPNILNNW